VGDGLPATRTRRRETTSSTEGAVARDALLGVFLARKKRQGRADRQRRWRPPQRVRSFLGVSSDVLAGNTAMATPT
jgi:hypothetical protein